MSLRQLLNATFYPVGDFTKRNPAASFHEYIRSRPRLIERLSENAAMSGTHEEPVSLINDLVGLNWVVFLRFAISLP